MRILWVATKAPWPPVDGGRLGVRALVVLGQSADPAHNGGAPIKGVKFRILEARR